jgi:two-component system response regulator (stage 0 sporulation protein F)
MTSRILVVDDDVNFRHLFYQTLRREGYLVSGAENGVEALRMLQNESYDLALIDIRMTPVDGLTVLKIIKKNYARMKVVMITAYGTPEFESDSFRLGADSYLRKPLEIQELKDVIQRTLSS